jgi:hypothetical protein
MGAAGETMTSPLYNICTRCGRRGHCAASCKEPINAEVKGGCANQ